MRTSSSSAREERACGRRSPSPKPIPPRHRAAVEGLSDAQPHLRGGRRCRRRGEAERQPRLPLQRHGRRRRLADRSGRGRAVRQRDPQRAGAAGALGLPVEPGELGARRGAAVRRHEDHAHVVRRRQDRLPHAAHAVPDVAEVSLDQALRRVLHHRPDGRRRRLPRLHRHRDAHRRDEAVPRQGGDHLHRRRRPDLPVHHQRRDQDRRRHGDGLPRRRAAEGHGVRAVPPDRAARLGHPADRGLPRRGRLPAEQGQLPLPAGLRPRPGDAEAGAEVDGVGPARPPQPGLLAGVRRRAARCRRSGATSSGSTCAISARS